MMTPKLGKKKKAGRRPISLVLYFRLSDGAMWSIKFSSLLQRTDLFTSSCVLFWSCSMGNLTVWFSQASYAKKNMLSMGSMEFQIIEPERRNSIASVMSGWDIIRFDREDPFLESFHSAPSFSSFCAHIKLLGCESHLPLALVTTIWPWLGLSCQDGSTVCSCHNHCY